MESRSQLRRWLTYLIVLAATSSLLLVSEETAIPVLSDSLLANWLESTRAKESDRKTTHTLSNTIDTLRSSRAWLSAWLNDDAWRTGVARYLEMAAEPRRADWVAPPAGRPITPEVQILQDAVQKEASNRTFQSIDVELTNSTPQSETAYYFLNIDTQGRTFRIDLPTKHAVIEPLIPGAGQLSLYVMRRLRGFLGFWGKEKPVTSVTTLPLAALRVGAAKAVTLTPLETDAHGGLRLQLTGGSSDINKFSRGDARKPEIVEANTDRVAVHEGEVSLNQLHASDHLFLKRSDRYTAIVVLGSSDLRGRVWCERDDDGSRIGAYASEIPLMAAASNAWASLRLTVRVHDPGDVLQYRVLAMSGRNLPSRELVLEVVGRYLTKMEVERRPISGPGMSRAVKWLAQALDARFRPEDAQAADAPEVRALIAHLVDLMAPKPRPGEVPRMERGL